MKLHKYIQSEPFSFKQGTWYVLLLQGRQFEPRDQGDMTITSWKNMAWGSDDMNMPMMEKSVMRILAGGQGDGYNSPQVYKVLGGWLDSVGI